MLLMQIGLLSICPEEFEELQEPCGDLICL